MLKEQNEGLKNKITSLRNERAQMVNFFNELKTLLWRARVFDMPSYVAESAYGPRAENR
jgi:hypothetical protein